MNFWIWYWDYLINSAAENRLLCLYFGFPETQQYNEYFMYEKPCFLRVRKKNHLAGPVEFPPNTLNQSLGMALTHEWWYIVTWGGCAGHLRSGNLRSCCGGYLHGAVPERASERPESKTFSIWGVGYFRLYTPFGRFLFFEEWRIIFGFKEFQVCEPRKLLKIKYFLKWGVTYFWIWKSFSF